MLLLFPTNFHYFRNVSTAKAREIIKSYFLIVFFSNLFFLLFSCIIHGKSFYYFVLPPIVCAILFNFMVLVRIMNTVRNSDVKFKDQKSSQDTNGSTRIKMVRIACTCTCIMGLSWILGIFALGEGAEIFSWLFTIFNSLQGFFIFVFHTLRNRDIQKEVRTLWKKISPRKKLLHGGSPNSISTRSTDTILTTIRR